VSRRQGDPWALSGMLFVAFFIASLVLGGMLASGPLHLSVAHPAGVVNYFTDNQTAALAWSLCLILSAVSLFVFVAPVATFVRSIVGERRALIWLTSVGGALAAVLLLASALFGLMLAVPAGAVGLDLVDTLRDLIFLSGGTLHVASLGLFIGATSIAAAKANALARWIQWLGIVASVLAILSLASLILYPASILIPLGRLLCYVWSIATSLVLTLGKQHKSGVRV
jgi:hypothetical protein